MNSLCLTLTWFNSTSSGLDDETCSTDFASITLSGLFVYVTVMTHMYLRICSKPSRGETPTAEPYLAHNLIWVVMILQFLLALCSLGEVVVIYAKQGHLLSVSLAETVLQLAISVFLPAYFDSVERRGLGTMLPVMAQSLGACLIYGTSFASQSEAGFTSEHLKHVTTFCSTALNASLFLLLCLGAAKRLYLSSVSISHPYKHNSGVIPDVYVYKYNEACLISKLTFSWMLPLLRQGYRSPLEIDDLHKLPSQEKARKHYEILKETVKEHPEKGILRACLLMNWPLVVIGGIFRLLADVFGFAGAVSIKFIVDAMSKDFEKMLNSTAPGSTGNNSTINLAHEEASQNHYLSQSYRALTLEEFFSDSYVISVIIFLAALGQGSFSQTSNHLLTVAGMRSKNALHVLLYEKSLRLPVGTVQHGSVLSDSLCMSSSCADEEANEGNIDIGFIMNLASEDILNIREFIWNIHYLWALPLKVVVITGLLYLKMGISGAAAVVLGTFVIVPLQFLTGKLMSDNNKRIFSAQDLRLYKSTETMQGMKTVKLGCLEDAMLNKIEESRNKELLYLRRDSFFWSVMAFLASVSTIIVTTAAVGLYVALEDQNFSAANLFSALALLGQLTVCLSVFPVTIPIFIKGMVSRERLLEFFSRTEVSVYKQSIHSSKFDSPTREDYEEDHDEIAAANGCNTVPEEEEEEEEEETSTPLLASGDAVKVPSRVQFPKVAFSVSKGTFAWPKTNVSALKDINIEVFTGSLTIVIGPSGSGKTALISSLMEEMERVAGELKWFLPAPVALMGQKPWLLNASVKDNILLGRPYKEKRYMKVLQACDLNADIELLPEGDETEVGERGVLLSGGQRQRLAIARCIYSKAACTFLDAPFSSLDSNITTHIFQRGVLEILLKRKRTVFMATDRVDFLDKAGHVIYMKDGTIKAQGTVQHVMQCHPELRINIKEMLSRSTSLAKEQGLVDGKTAQERWKLLKNVTRWSIFMKQMQREHGGVSKDPSVPKQGFHAMGILSKKLSSNKLARSQLRMDSSSQLNLCHDILLPSDECPDNSSSNYSPLSQKRQRPIGKPLTLGKGMSTANKRKTFSRAYSWSTSVSHSVKSPHSVQSQVLTAQPSFSSNGHPLRRPLSSIGGSSSQLIRQMAVTGAPPPAGNASSNSMSSTNSHKSLRKPPEFKRMSSVQLFKNRLFGSNHSFPKHSNSEPDGFSMDLNQFPAPMLSSRSTSRQSSYGQDLSMSMAMSSSSGVHSRIMRMTSNASAISQVSGFSDDFREDDGEDDGLILSREASNQERREYGQIGLNVYAEYFKAGGLHFALLFLILSCALQSIKVYMDFLLRDWSLEASDSISLSYFSSYSTFSILVLLLSCFANLVGQLIGARARRKLHARMLVNLLRCPLDLFEAYPIGRIINRFSYDMFVVDQKLPSSIQRLVLVSLICLSALTVNAIQSPIFIVFALPMVICYWWLQHYYRCTSRELQRLDSISRAPVLSHFSDTIGGLVTIRAFAEQQRFINQLCEKIDTNTTAFLVLQSGCRWLGVALDFTGAIMVFASVVINLLVSYQYPGERSSASIGLSMNYSLLVPIYLAWVVKFIADIENYMNAVERILEYTDLESEERVNEKDETVCKTIHELRGSGDGDIRFDCVGLSHSIDLRAVIQGLSLEIPSKQKVGICGRSGSGKSTLLMGLSRVAKLLYGRITIGGIDIASLPVKELRKHVWTVPQDVTLFSGTVRSNLDPEAEFTDDKIWESLELIGLKSTVLALEDGLETEVIENGDNFSHGQKQELSLARAVLLRPPVVILDEATSALDPAREIQLHKCLLKAFADSTLISVAHRLANIVSYDRVIVIGDGRIQEDGRPKELLEKKMGFFTALWRNSGQKTIN